MVARAQQAKSWELRAAMRMARLLHNQGKRQQGHDFLAPIHAWFIEGFDTLDLREAKVLRDALASEAAGTQSLFASTCQPSHTPGRTSPMLGTSGYLRTKQTPAAIAAGGA